ncbi:MAG: hypothetical protein OXG81_04955 [Acidobacteria bacterium]|nr:hypothetical protein [Acidobacteriota bacterium]
MKTIKSPKLVIISLCLLGSIIPPVTAQECEFDVWATPRQWEDPSCEKYPSRPGFETANWDWFCNQGSDCTDASNSELHEPFESTGSMSLTLTGDCGSTVSDTYCPYEWDHVEQHLLSFSAAGRDGRLQVVPVTPLGFEFQIQCDFYGLKGVDTYCGYCGHPCQEPIIISLRDQEYDLTDTSGGVWFDLSADGQLQRIPWTATNSDDALLVLDRNGNAIVDDGTELFSHVSPQPATDPGEAAHGFRALVVFDETVNGGNGDGQISVDDAIYAHLRLWLDVDHDGKTDRGELQALQDVQLTTISLDYTDANEHRDRHGNVFKFSAPAHFMTGRSVDAWVVYFNLETCRDCVLEEPSDDIP